MILVGKFLFLLKLPFGSVMRNILAEYVCEVGSKLQFDNKSLSPFYNRNDRKKKLIRELSLNINNTDMFHT